jgi:hypothetical protein
MYTINNPKKGRMANVAMHPPCMLVLHGSNQTISIVVVYDFLFP